MSMQCDNPIYEEVDVGNIQVKKNEVYGIVKQSLEKSPDDSPRSQKLPDVSPKGRVSTKTIVIASVVTAAVLVLLLMAATGSIVVEIYKMKFTIASNQQQNFAFSSVMESVWRNVSLEVAMQQKLTRGLEARLQQLQNFINVTLAALGARGSVLEAKVVDLVNSSSITHQLLNNSISNVSSALALYPPPSCDALPTSAPAGYYYILSPYSNHFFPYLTNFVECPPITTRCGQSGRWRTWKLQSNIRCLYPLRDMRYSNSSDGLCVRSSSLDSGCSSVRWSTSPFRTVCGSVRAYQFGSPDAFNSSASIDDPYVDGVSITYGRRPRRHIWSFAAASSEHSRYFGCGCIGGGSNSRPAFVGNDYFCDTGTTTGSASLFYGEDPLWDGAGCGSNNNCCTFNTPPWFYKELPRYGYDIELRVCRSSVATEEDIGLEAVTIYVK